MKVESDHGHPKLRGDADGIREILDAAEHGARERSGGAIDSAERKSIAGLAVAKVKSNGLHGHEAETAARKKASNIRRTEVRRRKKNGERTVPYNGVTHDRAAVTDYQPWQLAYARNVVDEIHARMPTALDRLEVRVFNLIAEDLGLPEIGIPLKPSSKRPHRSAEAKARALARSYLKLSNKLCDILESDLRKAKAAGLGDLEHRLRDALRVLRKGLLTEALVSSL